VSRPELVLLLANVVYGTSYAVTRLALDAIPPATLVLLRVALAAAVLAPLLRWRAGAGAPAPALAPGDRLRLAGMGALGFAAALACFHLGLDRSTTTNAALLITVEPLALVLLSPVVLGERLTAREAAGTAVALAGAALIVVNGVPGLTLAVAPHWRGDLLLILSGVAYASYTLIGRDLLARLPPLPVTAWSLAWGAAATLPLAVLEWSDGRWPRWSPPAVAGVLYLGLVITAAGYLVWNWALRRVPAPRVAIFLNVQPLSGVAIGVLGLGEPLTPFVLAGGLLVLAGVGLAMRRSATGGERAVGSRGGGAAA
jgi:drug/metabolite transporter (DMT)-like permease